MSTIQTHRLNNYEKWEKAQQQLPQIQSLQDCAPSQLYEKYRLLPTNLLYLTASNYGLAENTLLWNFSTQWKLIKIFDKKVKNGEDLPKVKEAIAKTIIDQNNIIDLRELYAVLTNDSETVENKSKAFSKVAKNNADLFEQIKYCLSLKFKKFPNAGSPEEIIQKLPNAKGTLIAVKQMIWVLKQGYRDCRNHSTFF